MLYKVFPVSKFDVCPERFLCQRLADKCLTGRNIAIYTASNFVFDPSIWFHSLESEDCRLRYFEARKILEAPIYHIENFFRQNKFRDLMEGHPMPKFVADLMGGEISPEIICILDIASPYLNRKAENANMVTAAMISRLLKYRAFCTIKDVETRDRIQTLINS